MTGAMTREPEPVRGTAQAASRDEQAAGSRSTSSQEPPAVAIAFQTVTVYFAAESALLTAQARTILDEVATRLIESPPASIRIAGHCALFGSERGRIALSRLRAEAVRDYLLGRGWRPESAPLIEALAGERPVTTDPRAQDLNRRVEIVAGER
jgi:outer membrane protein OmpA-like peptidoglycan-associated protein